jgi:hypothetical protein
VVSSLTERAVLCAHLAHVSCSSIGEIKAHSAIVYGDISVSIVGGYDNVWAYILTGPCMLSVSSCLEASQAEEIVITGAALAQLSTAQPRAIQYEAHLLPCGNYRIKVTSCHNTSTPLNPSPQLLADLRASAGYCGGSPPAELGATASLVDFIPRPVIEAISVSLLSNLCEFRTVTSVFVKIEVCPHDEEVPVIQKLFYGLQGCIADSGGFLRQFLVDDKGCVLIALWGVPTATFPNDCSRALRCAAAMRIKASGLLAKLSIGLNIIHIPLKSYLVI